MAKGQGKWEKRKFKALMDHALEQDDVQEAVCDRIEKISKVGKDQDFLSMLSIYARLTGTDVNIVIRKLVEMDE